MRTGIGYVGCLLTALCFWGGCGGPPNEPLWQQIDTLNEERNALKSRVDQLETENRTLQAENQTLLAIGEQDHRSALDRLERIVVRDRSGLYDKDQDGRAETLVVYLETIDKAQDRIKAPGRVEVELWDLNRPADKAQLGRWTVEPDQLKTLWSATLMTNYYRLTFDAGDQLTSKEKDLTIRVRFTDTLTGKVLSNQYVFEK